MSQITTTYATEQLATAVAGDKARGIGCPVSEEDLRILQDVTRSGCDVTLHITDRTFDSLVAELKGLRDYHWAKGALLPDGSRLQTDVESRANLSGCITAGNELIAAEQPFSIQWSLGSGQFLSLDLPTLKQIGLLQFQHIQAAQSRYAALRAMISAQSTTEQLDAVAAQMHEGWPA